MIYYVSLVVALVAAVCFGYVSARTIWYGIKTARTPILESAWTIAFRHHRRYGKLITYSIGLLVIAIIPVEYMLRTHAVPGGDQSWLWIHLMFVGLTVCSFIMLHIKNGNVDPTMHALFACGYGISLIGLFYTGVLLYVRLWGI